MSENNSQSYQVMDYNQIKEENEILRKRLQHLLKSDFIRSFDVKKLSTGEYVRDIREADKIIAVGKVLFVCDHRSCERCGGDCNHTHDVRHARNFELFPGSTNTFYEVERT